MFKSNDTAKSGEDSGPTAAVSISMMSDKKNDQCDACYVTNNDKISERD